MEPPHIDPSITEAIVAHAKIAFAALCGGLVRLLFRPAASLTKTFLMLFGCVSCGYWGTPAAMQWFAFDEAYAGAVGALLGFIGLSLAEGLLKAVDGFEFKAWLRNFLTKGTEP